MQVPISGEMIMPVLFIPLGNLFNMSAALSIKGKSNICLE